MITLRSHHRLNSFTICLFSTLSFAPRSRARDGEEGLSWRSTAATPTATATATSRATQMGTTMAGPQGH